MAARTRSRDSCTAVSGSPTIVNTGNPGAVSTSTSTSSPSSPASAQLSTLASISFSPSPGMIAAAGIARQSGARRGGARMWRDR